MFYHQIEESKPAVVTPTTLPDDNEIVQLSEHQKRAMYPFSERAIKIIQDYQIEVPFKIINLSDGISRCPQCGQTVSGYYPLQCQRIRTKTFWTGRWDNEHWDNSRPNHYRDDPEPRLKRIRAEQCVGWPKWGSENEYNRQKAFFETIERLPTRAELMNFGNGSGLEFKAATTDPMLQQQLRNLAISQAFEGIAREFGQVGEVVNEIVNRMNSAGSSLQGYY